MSHPSAIAAPHCCQARQILLPLAVLRKRLRQKEMSRGPYKILLTSSDLTLSSRPESAPRKVGDFVCIAGCVLSVLVCVGLFYNLSVFVSMFPLSTCLAERFFPFYPIFIQISVSPVTCHLSYYMACVLTILIRQLCSCPMFTFVQIFCF